MNVLKSVMAAEAQFTMRGLVNALIFILSILSIILQNNTVRGTMGLAVAGKVLSR